MATNTNLMAVLKNSGVFIAPVTKLVGRILKPLLGMALKQEYQGLQYLCEE